MYIYVVSKKNCLFGCDNIEVVWICCDFYLKTSSAPLSYFKSILFEGRGSVVRKFSSPELNIQLVSVKNLHLLISKCC